jgi:hypothetical protein
MPDRNGEDGSPEARRKKLMMVAREIGLTREERMELASYILRRDVRTWKSLDEVQVLRLLDALEGFELLSQLLALRVD